MASDKDFILTRHRETPAIGSEALVLSSVANGFWFTDVDKLPAMKTAGQVRAILTDSGAFTSLLVYVPELTTEAFGSDDNLSNVLNGVGDALDLKVSTADAFDPASPGDIGFGTAARVQLSELWMLDQNGFGPKIVRMFVIDQANADGSQIGWEVGGVDTAMGVTGGGMALEKFLTVTGAGTLTLRTTGATDITLPTTGTVATTANIAALVNSAPSTLDTLKELADALGDDPNFAATVSTALGLKALKSTTVVGAGGIQGGGDLGTNRTLTPVYPSQAEAEAGTEQFMVMNPLRTTQVISKRLNYAVNGLYIAGSAYYASNIQTLPSYYAAHNIFEPFGNIQAAYDAWVASGGPTSSEFAVHFMDITGGAGNLVLSQDSIVKISGGATIGIIDCNGHNLTLRGAGIGAGIRVDNVIAHLVETVILEDIRITNGSWYGATGGDDPQADPGNPGSTGNSGANGATVHAYRSRIESINLSGGTGGVGQQGGTGIDDSMGTPSDGQPGGAGGAGGNTGQLSADELCIIGTITADAGAAGAAGAGGAGVNGGANGSDGGAGSSGTASTILTMTTGQMLTDNLCGQAIRGVTVGTGSGAVFYDTRDI